MTLEAGYNYVHFHILLQLVNFIYSIFIYFATIDKELYTGDIRH